jgi:hypothetical protein
MIVLKGERATPTVDAAVDRKIEACTAFDCHPAEESRSIGRVDPGQFLPA